MAWQNRSWSWPVTEPSWNAVAAVQSPTTAVAGSRVHGNCVLLLTDWIACHPVACIGVERLARGERRIDPGEKRRLRTHDGDNGISAISYLNASQCCIELEAGTQQHSLVHELSVKSFVVRVCCN